MNSNEAILTDEQIQRYWRDGYIYGIPILTAKQMEIARKKLVELERKEVETDPKRWVDPDYQPWMNPGSPWWHWFQGMVRNPSIIHAVQGLLGPNVMVRNADIFVKPVGSEETIQWHADTASRDSGSDKMLTAWIAISDSTKKNGCMEWLTGSHRKELPPEIQDKYSLSYNRSSVKKIGRAPRQLNLLNPGQMSVHHFRTVHRSRYNRTLKPRIGLVVRFMATDTPIEIAESGKGTLVGGSNDPGHFASEPCFHVSWKRSDEAQLASPAK